MLAGDEFTALRAVAADVDPLLELFLVAMYETGHRANSVRQLRWTDLDLERRLVTWRKDGDKLGHEHTTALSATAAEWLSAAQRSRAAIGAVHVFPSPRRRGEPLSRHTLAKWWRMAEVTSKIGRVPGRGPHALRRMFANELRHVPLRDLADLGGWKSSQTIVEVYQQPDVDRNGRRSTKGVR